MLFSTLDNLKLFRQIANQRIVEGPELKGHTSARAVAATLRREAAQPDQ